MASSADVRARWLAYLHSTNAADRPRAEAGVRALYAAAGFREPDHLLWFSSPCAASWAVAALVPKEDSSGSQLLDPRVLSKEERERLERARADLRERVGALTWDDVLSAIGPSKGSSIEAMMDPSRTFNMAFVEARYDMVDDVSALFEVPDDDDELARAEAHFWGANRGVLNSALHCSRTDFLLRRSFVEQQTFSALATDHSRVGEGALPPILRAAGEIAQSSGLWWPYERAAILSDRPSEIRLNERHVPHCEDGPAVVFRDGWQVFAWNGKAVPERWIMQTESVPAGEYRGFDPTFAQWANSKTGPTRGSKKRAKPASIAKTVLSSDSASRLVQLRAHAGGTLPLYDRYVGGEHREVWKELIAMGSAAREDPNAADSLAVAYETMQRVESNVRMLVERLTAMGYVFAPAGAGRSVLPQIAGGVISALLWTRDRMRGQGSGSNVKRSESRTSPHVRPGPNAAREVADFEKEFGTLPLSLRAFYEVVGEVNFSGHHPIIDPPGNPVATDPLLVYGLDEGALEYDDDEEEGAPCAITIAPDDLHKANVSGGSPYTMAFPDPRADGELLDERHHLFFVDYLRLCFELGGFPGYEGSSSQPRELRALAEGLVAF